MRVDAVPAAGVLAGGEDLLERVAVGQQAERGVLGEVVEDEFSGREGAARGAGGGEFLGAGGGEGVGPAPAGHLLGLAVQAAVFGGRGADGGGAGGEPGGCEEGLELHGGGGGAVV